VIVPRPAALPSPPGRLPSGARHRAGAAAGVLPHLAGHCPAAAQRARLIEQAWSVDAHHDHVRFAWELANDDGEVAVGGIDVGELAQDGRLRRIMGFFGDLPAV